MYFLVPYDHFSLESLGKFSELNNFLLLCNRTRAFFHRKSWKIRDTKHVLTFHVLTYELYVSRQTQAKKTEEITIPSFLKTE